MLIDRNGLQENRGNSVTAVGEGFGGFGLASTSEDNGGVDSTLRKRAERLVDGHRLRAADDANDGGEVCIANISSQERRKRLVMGAITFGVSLIILAALMAIFVLKPMRSAYTNRSAGSVGTAKLATP